MKSTSLAHASSSVACLLAATLLATQEPPTASLRFVNATGAAESLTVRLNDELLQSRGYRSGEASGRLELAAGFCRIEFLHPRLGRVVLPLELQPGDVQTVVAVIEPSRATETPPQLASHVLVQPPPNPLARRRLRVWQTTPLEQLDLQVAGRELRCRRLRVESLSLEQPQPLLEHAGHALGRLPFDEAGDGTLILFADAGGRLRHLFFLDPAGSGEATDERR